MDDISGWGGLLPFGIAVLYKESHVETAVGTNTCFGSACACIHLRWAFGTPRSSTARDACATSLLFQVSCREPRLLKLD